MLSDGSGSPTGGRLLTSSIDGQQVTTVIGTAYSDEVGNTNGLSLGAIDIDLGDGNDRLTKISLTVI